MKIPERTQISLDGLNEMIDYLEENDDISNKTILEIGSWTGLSAIAFSKKFKKVICVDPFSPTSEINTQYNMKEVEKIFDSRTRDIKNIKKYKMTSETFASYIDFLVDSGRVKKIVFDYIYIDGIHSYDGVKKDILLFKDRINKAICGHDYCPIFPGVVCAVNELIGIPNKVFPENSFVKYRG